MSAPRQPYIDWSGSPTTMIRPASVTSFLRSRYWGRLTSWYSSTRIHSSASRSFSMTTGSFSSSSGSSSRSSKSTAFWLFRNPSYAFSTSLTTSAKASSSPLIAVFVFLLEIWSRIQGISIRSSSRFIPSSISFTTDRLSDRSKTTKSLASPTLPRTSLFLCRNLSP